MDRSKEAVSLFNKWAQHYLDKYWDVSEYAGPLDFFCQELKKENPEILELACGPGNVTSYVLMKRPDFGLLGTDLSENMVQLAREKNPGATFRVMDSRDIYTLGKQYDGIIMSFLLPYLTYEETAELIGHCVSALVPGGLLYLSAIEGDHALSGPQKSSKGDIVYMHYYLPADLEAFFKQNDLHVLHESKTTTVMANGQETVDLLYVVKKAG